MCSRKNIIFTKYTCTYAYIVAVFDMHSNRQDSLRIKLISRLYLIAVYYRIKVNYVIFILFCT